MPSPQFVALSRYSFNPLAISSYQSNYYIGSMETIVANKGSARRVTSNGRQYIVVPMTMKVSGVLKGSKGPLYYPEDEIHKSESLWNGMPIVVYHPVVNGRPVSARNPEIIAKQGVGTVYKSKARDGKLTAEAWFDVEDTKRVDSRVLSALETNTPIGLSTGLFTEDIPAPPNSVYNGKPYSHIATNYRSDHLAVLPDQRGACSIEDGCGILINAGEELHPRWTMQDDGTLVENANPDGCNQYTGPGCSVGSAHKTDISIQPSSDESSKVLTVKSGSVGVLNLKHKGDSLKVFNTEVDEKERGKGIGVAMYLQAVDYAKENRLRMVSDATVEEGAVRVWESLKKRGFPVEKSPMAKEIDVDGGKALFVSGSNVSDSVFSLDFREKATTNAEPPSADSLANEAWEFLQSIAEENGEALPEGVTKDTLREHIQGELDDPSGVLDGTDDEEPDDDEEDEEEEELDEEEVADNVFDPDGYLVANADCGTGSGGFKKGNTCAGGSSKAPKYPRGNKDFGQVLKGISDDELEGITKRIISHANDPTFVEQVDWLEQGYQGYLRGSGIDKRPTAIRAMAALQALTNDLVSQSATEYLQSIQGTGAETRGASSGHMTSKEDEEDAWKKAWRIARYEATTNSFTDDGCLIANCKVTGKPGVCKGEGKGGGATTAADEMDPENAGNVAPVAPKRVKEARQNERLKGSKTFKSVAVGSGSAIRSVYASADLAERVRNRKVKGGSLKKVADIANKYTDRLSKKVKPSYKGHAKAALLHKTAASLAKEKGDTDTASSHLAKAEKHKDQQQKLLARKLFPGEKIRKKRVPKPTTNTIQSDGTLVDNCGGKGGKPGPCPKGGANTDPRNVSDDIRHDPALAPSNNPNKAIASSQKEGSGKRGSLLSQLLALSDGATAKGKAVIASVSAKTKAKYEKLEKRYGKNGARAVMAGIVLSLGVPLPGSTFIPIGVAEGLRGADILAKKLAGKIRKRMGKPALATNANPDGCNQYTGPGCSGTSPNAYDDDDFSGRNLIGRALSELESKLGSSAVKDRQGKPIVAYHGSNEDFDTFRDEPTYFSPDPRYGFVSKSSQVHTAFLDIKNPYHTDYQSEVERIGHDKEYLAELKAKGYDGIVYSKKGDMTKGSTGFGNDYPQYIPFSASQIVHVGKYDKDDFQWRLERGDLALNAELPTANTILDDGTLVANDMTKRKWEEAKHKRADDGKFSSGGGGDTSSGSKTVDIKGKAKEGTKEPAIEPSKSKPTPGSVMEKRQQEASSLLAKFLRGSYDTTVVGAKVVAKVGSALGTGIKKAYERYGDRGSILSFITAAGLFTSATLATGGGAAIGGSLLFGLGAVESRNLMKKFVKPIDDAQSYGPNSQGYKKRKLATNSDDGLAEIIYDMIKEMLAAADAHMPKLTLGVVQSMLAKLDVQDEEEATANAFCATGEGGGVDPSCGKADKKEFRGSVDGALKAAFGHTGFREGGSYDVEHGDFEISVVTRSKDNSVRIDFSSDMEGERSPKQTGEGENTSVNRDLQSGTLDMLRRLRTFATELGKKGVAIVHSPSDERRRKLYNRALTTAGYTLVKPGKQERWEPTSTPTTNTYLDDEKWLIANVFCATGSGGGIDPTCGKDGTQSKLSSVWKKLSNSEYNLVSIPDIHDAIGGDIADLHTTLKDLRKKGVISLVGHEGRHGATDRDRASWLPENGTNLNFVSIREGQSLSSATHKDAKTTISEVMASVWEPEDKSKREANPTFTADTLKVAQSKVDVINLRLKEARTQVKTLMGDLTIAEADLANLKSKIKEASSSR